MAKIPQGYTITQMSDGTRILVPEFMVAAANIAFDAHQSKIALEAENAPGGVSIFQVYIVLLINHHF
jgi:hypothetical protein